MKEAQKMKKISANQSTKKSAKSSVKGQKKSDHLQSPNKNYYFGKLKKISLDNLEVFGTISSSISEKEINSLELIA